jgi:VWFA-related protein
MLRRTFIAAAAGGVLSAQTAPAPGQNAPQPSQTEPSQAGKTINVQVNEVIVPVTVTDDRGRFVSNLDKGDFKVYDGGKEQAIQFFSRERNQPVVVGFLVDLSNTSRLHWKTYQEAASELVRILLTNDPKYSGYLISFASEPELQVNTTIDPDKITDKIGKMKPGGGSSLYDAIYMACTSRKLVKGEPTEPRRIVVVIGDGNDNASKKTLEEVLEIAQRNLVTIYGVSTVAYGFNSVGDKNLIRLAEETGGRVEYPLQNVYKDVAGYLETPSDEGNYALKVGTGGYASAIATGMFKAIAAVAGEVTTQYIIRYTPSVPESDKVFRNIKVEVNLPAVKIRARKGYYPMNPS